MIGRRTELWVSTTVVSIRLLFALRLKSEEARSGQVGSRDLIGDLREGGVSHAAMFKSVLGHRHRMDSATPFAHEARAGLQIEAGRGTNPARGAQGLRKCLEFAKCRLAKSTVFDFLTSVSNTENQEVSADLGWLTLI